MPLRGPQDRISRTGVLRDDTRGDMSKRDETKSSAEPRLRVEIEAEGESTRVVFSGELDLATVGFAEKAMTDLPEAKTLVLDLRQLTFLDSSGLRLILLSADTQIPRVFVVRGPAQVARVFDLTGAAERLNLVDDPSLIDAA